MTSRLVYTADGTAGFRRRRNGERFVYVDLKGAALPAGKHRRRIDALAIPPAWEEVWINSDPDGHLQATGRDARGRKQYIYHPGWRAWRDQSKFEHILEFASRLPRLRRRASRDLRGRSLSSDLVCAAAVRVLEETLMRVGNDEYASQNRTFGLTTLRNRHLKRKRGAVLFSFIGKHGKPFEAELADRRVRAVLRRLEGLPGQHLFQYVDADGQTRRIRSDEINSYIRTATGGDFTAKDFRTWAATVLAVELAGAGEGDSAPTRKSVAELVRKVAGRLGNTPAVCRKSYIHPAVIETWIDGGLGGTERTVAAGPAGLSAGEKRALQLLRQRTKTARKPIRVKLVELLGLAA